MNQYRMIILRGGLILYHEISYHESKASLLQTELREINKVRLSVTIKWRYSIKWYFIHFFIGQSSL
jgi:hypothetical protein